VNARLTQQCPLSGIQITNADTNYNGDPVNPMVTGTDYDRDNKIQRQFALYGDLTYRLDRWQFELGLRTEYYNSYENAYNNLALQAPDVAFSELAVGTVAVPLLFRVEQGAETVSIGAPVRPSWNGNPLRVRAAASGESRGGGVPSRRASIASRTSRVTSLCAAVRDSPLAASRNSSCRSAGPMRTISLRRRRGSGANDPLGIASCVPSR